ncbi:MAG: GrpB family protein [Armatimonadota bacterium]
MSQQRTIIVEDYNPEWVLWFTQISDHIQAEITPLAVRIEHVGSTSVPGLAAKPIIDVDIVLPSINLLPQLIGQLATLGYTHEGDLGINGREAFRQPSNGLPPHHLYACVFGTGALADHMDLRDYLRSHPEAATEYGNLKKQLSVQYPHDIDLYIAGKTPFITRCLRLARKQ